MFSSEQKFVVNGDTKEKLKLIIETALKYDSPNYNPSKTNINCYKIDERKGLIFGWAYKETPRGYTSYPMDISLDIATEIAWSYLSSNEANFIYSTLSVDDIDGSVCRGWKVFVPSWYGDNMIDDCNYSIIGICPDWIYYAK